jgi:hypothetical protein
VYHPYPIEVNGVRISRVEHQLILKERRATIEAAARNTPWTSSVPMSWRRGWKATWEVLGRDWGSNLKVCITVRIPDREQPYVRLIRLIKPQPLSADLIL